MDEEDDSSWNEMMPDWVEGGPDIYPSDDE